MQRDRPPQLRKEDLRLLRAKQIIVSAYHKDSVRATVYLLESCMMRGVRAYESDHEQEQLREFLRREQIVVIGTPATLPS